MTVTDQEDPCSNLVAGHYLTTSLTAFKARARTLLLEQQRMANPDSALVDFICEGVRLAREYAIANGRDISGAIQVCSSCRRAGCFLGTHPCGDPRDEPPTFMGVTELVAQGLEDPEFWETPPDADDLAQPLEWISKKSALALALAEATREIWLQTNRGERDFEERVELRQARDRLCEEYDQHIQNRPGELDGS